MAQGRRVERVASLIRREMSELLRTGVRDERVSQGMVSITTVVVAGAGGGDAVVATGSDLPQAVVNTARANALSASGRDLDWNMRKLRLNTLR